MNNCRFYLVIILFLISVINLFSQNGWNGKIEDDNGIPIIVNSDKPIHANPTIKLHKQWEVGGEDPGFIFNNITAIDVDDSSRVYVTDVLEKNVKVFSSSGVLLFTFGRQGQGPGEFQSPRCLTILPTKKILIIDTGGGLYPRFKIFNVDGKYMDGFTVELRDSESSKDFDENSMEYLSSLNMIWYSELYSENSLLLSTTSTEKMKFQVNSLWIYDLSKRFGKEIIKIKEDDPRYSNQRQHNDRVFLFRNTQWCHDNNGTIYFLEDKYEYTIKLYDRNGDLMKIINRDFELPKKTKEEYEKGIDQGDVYEKQMRKSGRKADWQALKEKPIIFNLYPCTRSMFCDDQNRLWILTNESFSSNIRFSFDVFSQEGKYLMKIPFDVDQPRCFIYNKSFIYFADLGHDGFPWLFKYKITE